MLATNTSALLRHYSRATLRRPLICAITSAHLYTADCEIGDLKLDLDWGHLGATAACAVTVLCLDTWQVEMTPQGELLATWEVLDRPQQRRLKETKW